MSVQAKQQNFVSRQIEINERLVQAYEDYLSLRAEYDALGGANWLDETNIVGDVAHVTKANLVAAFVSLENLQVIINQGNLTNFLRLRR